MVPLPGHPAAAIPRDDTATTSHDATWAIRSAGGSMRDPASDVLVTGVGAVAAAGEGGVGAGVGSVAPLTRLAGTTRAASSALSSKKSSQAIQSLSRSSRLGSSGYVPLSDVCASAWLAKSSQLRSAWACKSTLANISNARIAAPEKATLQLLAIILSAATAAPVVRRCLPPRAGL